MGRPLAQFHGVFGQRNIIRRLQGLMDGSLQQGRAYPHVAFYGPAGIGKTALAEAIAAGYYGTKLHYVPVHPRISPATLLTALHGLTAGDILFLDEAHLLRPSLQPLLYPALDIAKAAALTKDGFDPTRLESLASFSLFVATNVPSGLTKALRSRLLEIIMEPYSVDELAAMARAACREAGVELTGQAAGRIAEVARTTPRRVGKLVRELMIHCPGQAKLGTDDVAAFFEILGIDDLGLSRLDRQYLQMLQESPRQISSLLRLALLLGQDRKYIEEDVEPVLMRLGLVEIATGHGRRLTAAGQDALDRHSPPVAIALGTV